MRVIEIVAFLASLSMVAFVGSEKVELIAGGGSGGDGDKATAARLVEPFGVGFDRAGNLYIVEFEGGERVRKVDKRGLISTVVGTGEQGFSGDGGPATKAQIDGSHHLLVLPDGAILLADTWNNRVRQVNPRTGIITTIAGTGEKGFSGDGGPATKAQMGAIYCLALSPKGDTLYLCDLDNRRIRALDRKTGILTTVAGNGQRGVPTDGADATASPLVDPRAVATDAKGNLYILERGGNALRVVDSFGKIRTVLGDANTGITAEVGKMNGPKHLCVDGKGNVYIADTENQRILRYDPRAQRLQQVVGTGKPPTADRPANSDTGGSALEVSLNRPHGVFVRPDGTLYIADSSNGRILRVSGDRP